MIKKISLVLITFSLLIALPLALVGFKYVDVGTPMLAFFKSTVRDLEDWKFEIPNVPYIEHIESSSFWLSVLDYLIFLGNIFLGILNLSINVMNVVIYIIQFFIAIIMQILSLVGVLQNSGYHENPYSIPPVSVPIL